MLRPLMRLATFLTTRFSDRLIRRMPLILSLIGRHVLHNRFLDLDFGYRSSVGGSQNPKYSPLRGKS